MESEPVPDVEIVAENIRVVQAVYAAWQFEQLHLFEAGDRLVELFRQGLLPIGPGSTAERRLLRAATEGRLSAVDRATLFARVLDLPGGDDSGEPDRGFQCLWLRFVAAVSAFAGRQRDKPNLQPLLADATVRSAARALAVQASHAGGYAAARQLAEQVRELIALLDDAAIQQSFGAGDMWQVIDRVNRDDLGGASNLHRHRTLAQAGETMLQWLAAHSAVLADTAPADSPAAPIADVPDDAELLTAVAHWLAACDVAGAVTSGFCALFCGAAGTGKTLAAHWLASTLSQELRHVRLGPLIGRYIGETEKNLASVLADAEQSGVLLLLDEAEALFGRRSEIADAHDRFDDDERARCRQRIAAHRGPMILESRTAATAEHLPSARPSGGRGVPVLHFVAREP